MTALPSSPSASSADERFPLWAYALLLQPARVVEGLDRLEGAGLLEERPSLWQLSQGVMRMVQRLVLRPESVGMCTSDGVRDSWRARLLERRALRFPFLVAERAVAPLDLSGLLSSRERIIRHLLGAHHDAGQFIYDLELLVPHEGALEELRDRAQAVVDSDDARSRWLRDLVVYEGYHERLLERVERTLVRGVELSLEEERDPDVSFLAYLRWCAGQPASPRETLRAWRDASI